MILQKGESLLIHRFSFWYFFGFDTFVALCYNNLCLLMLLKGRCYGWKE